MEKKYDNEGRISLWEAQSGKTAYTGVVTINGVDYKIALFHNEPTSDRAPVLTGKMTVKEAK